MAKPYKKLRDSMSQESQGRASEKANQLIHEMRLSDLREAVNLTQAEIAERMGVSQSAISQIENSDRNLYLSTLARFVESTGGQLVVSAHYPNDEVKLTIKAV